MTERYSLYAAASGAIVLLDQFTKALVQERMMLHESIPIIPAFFSLTYIRNPGAAFGLFVGADPAFRAIFFLTITAVAILVIGYFFVKSIQEDRRAAAAGNYNHRHNRWTRAGLALVLAGAIGNLIDRVRYGEVIDFLDFYVGRYHWPAFNVADSSITIGVTVLLIAAWLAPAPPKA
ncbi:MAG: signal peptidase II [Nitrospirota bacterium]